MILSFLCRPKIRRTLRKTPYFQGRGALWRLAGVAEPPICHLWKSSLRRQIKLSKSQVSRGSWSSILVSELSCLKWRLPNRIKSGVSSLGSWVPGANRLCSTMRTKSCCERGLTHSSFGFKTSKTSSFFLSNSSHWMVAISLLLNSSNRRKQSARLWMFSCKIFGRVSSTTAESEKPHWSKGWYKWLTPRERMLLRISPSLSSNLPKCERWSADNCRIWCCLGWIILLKKDWHKRLSTDHQFKLHPLTTLKTSLP